MDGIVFDLYWYGKETDMGRLEWNRQQFPDPRRMLDSLNNMGVHGADQSAVHQQGRSDRQLQHADRSRTP